MNLEELTEIGKSWGPLGVIAWLMLQAYLRRSPDAAPEHEAGAIDHLRTDLMAEMKELLKQIGDLRDRVARIEGALSRHDK